MLNIPTDTVLVRVIQGVNHFFAIRNLLKSQVIVSTGWVINFVRKKSDIGYSYT